MAGRWGVYEVGALAALHDALPTLDFTRLHSYVGVSAGAFVTAGLANGITPREMVQLFIENEGEDGDALSPGVFMRPALREYASRVANPSGAVMAALWASAVTATEPRTVRAAAPGCCDPDRAIRQSRVHRARDA